jgi:DNA polymerase-3 subunit gamma/tau
MEGWGYKMTLHLKYRPQTLEEIIGNDEAVKSLQKVLNRKQPAQSYLFTGPPGCGKTTLARIIKNHLDIEDMNFFEYNTANTRGIDTIRQIEENCKFAGMGSGKKLYLLDECHQITPQGLNAILKILEEPPPHVYFVMCTAEIETIKQTIRKAFSRRCHQYEVRLLRSNELMKLMKKVLTSEGKKSSVYLKLLKKIVEVSNGSPGQCLKLLDETYQLNINDGIKTIEHTTVNESQVIDLCRLLTSKKPSNEAKWPKIQSILKGLNSDPEQIRYAILGYCNSIMLGNNHSPTVANLMGYFMDSFMYTGKAGLTLACYMMCFGELQDDIAF